MIRVPKFEGDIELSVSLRKETEKAYLIALGRVYLWVPKSLSSWSDEEGSVMKFPRWVAHRAGLVFGDEAAAAGMDDLEVA